MESIHNYELYTPEVRSAFLRYIYSRDKNRKYVDKKLDKLNLDEREIKKFKNDELKIDDSEFKDLEIAYNSLNDLQKNIINNLVQKLRPNFKAPFKEILSAVLEAHVDISSSDLAKLIVNHKNYLEINGISSDNDSMETNAKRLAIDSLKTVSKPKKKSKPLISEISKLLSIEESLLETGRGKIFDIDEERIDEFMREHIEIKEADNKELENFKKKHKNNKISAINLLEYLNQDAREIGNSFALESNEPYADYTDFIIVIEFVCIQKEDKYVLVPVDEVPFKEFFFRLETVKEQEAVAELIFGLHLVEGR